MADTISNSDDIIDSRDVIERIAELDDGNDRDDDEQAELEALRALAEEAEGYAPDWNYGATLIRETYFSTYCEEMLKDIGDLPQELPGYIAIDWDKTADNIRVDYTEVDFDGVPYLVR